MRKVKLKLDSEKLTDNTLVYLPGIFSKTYKNIQYCYNSLVNNIPEIKEISETPKKIKKKCCDITNGKPIYARGNFSNTYKDGNRLLKIVDILNTRGIDHEESELISNTVKLNLSELRNIKNFLKFFIEKNLSTYICNTYVFNGTNIVNLLDSSLDNIEDYICEDLFTYNIFYYMDDLTLQGCVSFKTYLYTFDVDSNKLYNILKEILHVTYIMNNNNYMHGDLHFGNMFICENEGNIIIKFIDLGTFGKINTNINKLAILEYFAVLNNIINILKIHKYDTLIEYFVTILRNLQLYFTNLLETLYNDMCLPTIKNIIQLIYIFALDNNSTGYRRNLFNKDSINEAAIKDNLEYISKLSECFNLLCIKILAIEDK